MNDDEKFLLDRAREFLTHRESPFLGRLIGTRMSKLKINALCLSRENAVLVKNPSTLSLEILQPILCDRDFDEMAPTDES